MSDPIGHSLTVHVSPHGDDRASGIAAAPLRSLTVARDRLRPTVATNLGACFCTVETTGTAN